MTRSIFAGLLGLFSIAAVGALPLACQSGGIGDPCIPEDEYNAAFAGFKLTEENIESRSFQCSTRICLVNHFQGRTSCPEGQDVPKVCIPSNLMNPGKDSGNCAKLLDDVKTTAMCVEADVIAPDCVPPADCSTSKDCASGTCGPNKKCTDPCPSGLACDPNRKVCACSSAAMAPEGYACVPSNSADKNSVNVLKSFVCHKPGNCQVAGAGSAANKGKDCCVPGTDTPTTSLVCGQCGKEDENKRKVSTRSADQSVYCSCRCGIAEGALPEDDFNFCECPTGFSCSEVRPSVGIGDRLTTGKYCVKEGTEYKRAALGECDGVTGFSDDKTCSR